MPRAFLPQPSMGHISPAPHPDSGKGNKVDWTKVENILFGLTSTRGTKVNFFINRGTKVDRAHRVRLGQGIGKVR